MLDRLRRLRAELQAEKRRRFGRRVSFADLVTDRWENARECGFGAGTSCYDNVLVLGDVRVGENTWIGPGAILDGSGGGLVIGSHCSISAGVHIYTHNTVRWSTTLGRAPHEYAPTRLGDGVYVGPGSVVAMGVTIGDSAVVGALSYVDRDLPARMKAWGRPARVRGPIAEDADR